MSLASRLAVPLFVLAPLIAATPARAEATADGAASLQAQIRAWMSDLAANRMLSLQRCGDKWQRTRECDTRPTDFHRRSAIPAEGNLIEHPRAKLFR